MSLLNDIYFLKKLDLERFQDQNNNKFLFRCPICGDSEKSKIKRRGYASPNKNGKDALHIYCHNCSYSSSFSYFLKVLHERGIINSDLIDEYTKSSLVYHIKEDKKIVLTSEEYNQYRKKEIEENKYIRCIKNIKNHDEFKKYLEKRFVREEYWNGIYATFNFKKMVNICYTKKYKMEFDSSRIVFPLYYDNYLSGIQGRTIETNEKVRYYTVKLIDDSTLCYIPKKVNLENIVYLTEGIFDALMLDQGCAMIKSNISLDFVKNKFKNPVFIFDNESRNQSIVRNYDRIASLEGFGLFIWPKNIKSKDLNDLKKDKTFKEIEDIVQENTFFSCMEKMINVSRWKNF